MVNEAEDRVLAVGAGLADLALELVFHCPSVQAVVYLDGARIEPRTIADRRTFELEALLAEHGAAVRWGDFDEETPAGALLHLGHHGRAEGRALHPSLQLPSHPARATGPTPSR